MKFLRIITIFIMINLVAACSPIDSVRPFDAQARKFVLLNYTQNPAQKTAPK